MSTLSLTFTNTTGLVVSLPITGTGVAVSINWGDGNTNTSLSHTYVGAGPYTAVVTITSSATSVTTFGSFNWPGVTKLTNVSTTDNTTWGLGTAVSSFANLFYGAFLLTSVPTGIPLSVTNMTSMFQAASAFNQNISAWNVSNVANMTGMFLGASAFNQNISAWNVSNVANMSYMFYNAIAFNQNISAWNVSSVENMSYMFQSASAFNNGGSALSWSTGTGTSNVTNMTSMFYFASAFNQNISAWNVSNVANMSYMFYFASAFNQNISAWNVSNVANMSYMFYNAIAFNQNISAWNVSNVANMSFMFYVASAFNQNISAWNVSNVTNMSYMFQSANAFNQNISAWNVSNVANMSFMFANASSFNNGGSALSWSTGTGTSNVTNMTSMFYVASAFNQNISAWNVSNVTNMTSMFFLASAFNQNIGAWNVSNVVNMSNMFQSASAFNNGGSALSWSTGTGTSNVANMSYMFYGASAFNQNISAWNVSNVANMSFMFQSASAFNQNIGAWNVSNVANMSGMFQYCTSLTSITIPNSVTTIQDSSFYGCSSLSALSIPSSVTSIQNNAFYNCSMLNIVYFLQTSTLPTIDANAFAGISVSSVGKYYSSVSNASSIVPFFNSISPISNSPPTLTYITPFTGTENTLSVISYTDLVANGNEVVDNPPFVFLVQSISSGSLTIGTTQGTATPWNASTNNTINASNNAYWIPPMGASGLVSAFSVVVEDAIGNVSSPNVQVNIVLTAIYSVSYDGNTNTGGTAPVDPLSPYLSGSPVSVEPAGSLTKTGYTFTGWNTLADGTGSAYSPGDTFFIYANTTLYAQWTITTYTMAYNGNTNTGGTAPVDPLSPYNYGSLVSVEPAGSLTKTGYTFTGWNTNAVGTGTAYSPGDTFFIYANTTLYAQWTITTYTMAYNGNTNTGGTAPVDPLSPYNYGSLVSVEPAGSLTKTGYTFTGWNTNAVGTGTSYSPGDTFFIYANTTLYAQWRCSVTYDGNTNTSGTAPTDGSSPYTPGSSVSVLGNTGSLEKSGFTFVGWNTLADGTGTAYSEGNTFLINANTILYAQWKCSVTYDGNTNTSGTAPTDGSSPYTPGSSVSVLGNTGSLEKSGFTFVGWNTLADGTGTAYSEGNTFLINANTILYAEWRCSVTYDGNTNTSGTAPTDGSSPYTPGSSVSVLGNTGSLEKTGFTFAGWNTLADGTGTSYSPTNTFTINADTTLYAQWKCSVTYDGNTNTSGTPPTDGSSPYTPGSSVSVLGNTGSLEKSGFTFVGWNTLADGTGTAYSEGNTFLINANTILYAQWKCSVTYDGNTNTSGTPPTDGSSPYTPGSSVSVLGNTGSLEKSGFTFAGWNTLADGTGTSYSPTNTFTINANTILYAQWKCSVTYDGNTNTSGTAPTDGSSPYTPGSSVSVLGNTGSLEKSGFTFVGWNTLADGTGTAYSEGNTFLINANTILYAQWKCSVTYDGNTNTSGTAPTDGSSPYTPGSSVSVLGNTGSLEKSGFTFVGWNTLADGTGTAYSEGNTFLINANTILYAEWRCSVTYDGNTNTSGTAPTDGSSPYTPGSSVSVLGNTGSLEKTGFTFAGWNTLADGTGTSYSPTNTFTINADTTLYAQWKCSVTYDGNTNTSGTPPTDGSSPYTPGSSVSVLGNTGSLEKSGFTFVGWNTLADGTGTAYSEGNTFLINANTILYAQWKCSVTYDGNTNTSGTPPTDGSSPYTPGSSVSVLGNTGSLEKSGFTFAGWNTLADGTGTSYSPTNTFTINANTILYAQWKCSVTYDGNTNTSGTAPTDGSSPYTPGSSVSVLGNTGSLEKSGFTFVGWNTLADGTGTSYSPTNTFTINANTILYAQWKCSVTYDGNTNTSGTAPTDGSSPYTPGSSVSVLGNTGSLAKTCFTFAGWNTLANGTGIAYSAGDTFTINANTILYAQWSPIPYTITYNGNTNTSGTAPVDGLSPYNCGSSVSVLGNTGSLVKPCFTFTGWNTLANGAGTAYSPTSTFSIYANTILYAQWELLNTTRYCPVPKIKGLYYPTQEQLYKQFKNENCNIQKKLPGTLGGRYVGALSGAMRKSQWIGLGAASKGQTRFVLNADELGMRQGQPGGILAPIRNRF